MAQALYRKYRSKSLDEIVGQEHITNTLSLAIKSGRISHAYLFTGPRGVGKTSIARILAHEVNELPYDSDRMHLDIIEIDAASNRRIDEIRDLREKVHIAPSSARYKVYIIDEVHMLTKESFNALLKTLEEPPEHCIFILATTEAHKLPETIISRTQRFVFKPVPSNEVVNHLQEIAKKEKIKISKEALELIAAHGGGSFRDSISLLDQVGSLRSDIDLEMVEKMIGIPPKTTTARLLDLLEHGNHGDVLAVLTELNEQGYSPASIAKELSHQLRISLSSHTAPPFALSLLKQLLDIPSSQQPQDLLEIVLLSVNQTPLSPLPTKKEEAPAKIIPKEVLPEAPETDQPEQKAVEPKKSANQPMSSGSFSLEQWPEVVNAVKSTAASLYTALRLASPRLDNDHLTLAFQFSLHQKKVDQVKHKQLIQTIIEERFGSHLVINCVVDKTAQPREDFHEPTTEVIAQTKVSTEDPTSLDAVGAISNIFGGAEMLES